MPEDGTSEQPKREHSAPDKPMLVGGGTDAHKLATAIANRAQGAILPVLEYIGAGPANQANKAIAIANSLLAGSGIYLSGVPSFVQREMGGQKITAMQLRVLKHPLGG